MKEGFAATQEREMVSLKRSPRCNKREIQATIQGSQHLVLKKGWDCSATSKKKNMKKRGDLEDVRLHDSLRITKKFGSRIGESNNPHTNRSSTKSIFSINSTSQLVVICLLFTAPAAHIRVALISSQSANTKHNSR